MKTSRLESNSRLESDEVNYRLESNMEEAGEATEGPMWGHPMPVLGALSSFLEPFGGHLSPKLDKVSWKLTFEIPPQRASGGAACADQTERVWPVRNRKHSIFNGRWFRGSENQFQKNTSFPDLLG